VKGRGCEERSGWEGKEKRKEEMEWEGAEGYKEWVHLVRL